MSLNDLLKSYQGGTLSSYTPRSTNPRAYRPAQTRLSGRQDEEETARNSRERSIPERVDVNRMFGGPVPEGEEAPAVPFQLIEGLGKAPGFIAERPIAVADSLLDDEEGQSPLDALGQIPGVELLGDIVNNISTLPGAVANQSTIETLGHGVKAGWQDSDTLDKSTLAHLADNIAPALAAIPFIGSALGAIKLVNDNDDKPTYQTWGDYKADARKRGFTADDVQGYLDGTKAAYDFGDRAMSSDPGTELALRLGSDPLNLLFGAGVAIKSVQGVGLLGRAIKAGAIAEKFESPTLVAAKLAGEAATLGLGGSKGATWLGLAKSFETLGRASQIVPGAGAAATAAAKGLSATGKGLKAYQKVSIATTGAQLGLLGAAQTPLAGPLAGLFEINQKAWDNQPLSSNSAFALLTAFHFDLTYLAGKGLSKVKDSRYRVMGDNTRALMLDALSEDFHGPGQKATHNEVIEALGGPSALDDLIVHTHAQAAFERVMQNPVIKAALSHFDSLDEAMLKNAKLHDMIATIVQDDYVNGRVNGKQTVKGFKAWFAQRADIDQPRDFAWNGRQAVDRWVSYGGAARSVQQVFRERGGVVIGLVDNLMSEDVWNLQALARIAGGQDRQVPVATVRDWLSRFPTMVNEGHNIHGADAKWWGQYLGPEWDGKTVPLAKIQGKLKKLGNDAPSARDMTAEMADAERKASDDEWAASVPDDYAGQGVATLNVSRVRPVIARRLKIQSDDIDSASTARRDPDVAAYESRVGEELSKRGFRVDSVEQTLGTRSGSTSASVDIIMSEATVAEMRLAAALLGESGKAPDVNLTVGGTRMRELGLEANGYEVVLALPNTERGPMAAINQAFAKEFESFDLNDTSGIVRLSVKAGTEVDVTERLARVTAEIGDLYERDSLGASTIKTSVHPAYVETISQKKGPHATYSEVIRESKGDQRAGLGPELAAALAHRPADAAHAQGGLGSPEAMGRDASNGGPASGQLSQPPAERVGLGRPTEASADPGFLYHATSAEALAPIAEQGLVPQAAKKLAWADGGTSRRTFFSEAPAAAFASVSRRKGDKAIIRVAQADGGKLRTDRVEGAGTYTTKRVEPSLVEVFGADGQWHRLDRWFEATVEPDIAAAAAPVQAVYSSPSVKKAQFQGLVKDAFQLDDAQAGDLSAMADARARAWASMSPERTVDQWYEKNFAGIMSGGQPGAFHQILRRNEGIQAVGLDDDSLRGLIEEPEPTILAEHGLGGTSELEWIQATNGRAIAIPGGVEGLATGEFTLWDLWRLKSQGIDPKLLSEDVRVGLYQKLFRSQARSNDNIADVFNRISFATLSPLTNLTQNEGLATRVRVTSMDDIHALAKFADDAEALVARDPLVPVFDDKTGAPVIDPKTGTQKMSKRTIQSEAGYAINLDRRIEGSANAPDKHENGIGVGLKSITTNKNLGYVAMVARLVRDNEDFFVQRSGETALEFSERLMNVLPGSGMKVGNFAAMLSDPFGFDRGTIDSHMVEVLWKDGLVPEADAKKLLKLDKDGNVVHKDVKDKDGNVLYSVAQGDAPSGRDIVYRKPDGSINPEVPAHLRDLPNEPAGNKVTIYGGAYELFNEALRKKYEASGLADKFGLGGYQWYLWDQKRGKMEPHTVIFPGADRLPMMEHEALGGALRAHKAAGFLADGDLSGMAMSPREALFYQEAPLPKWAQERGVTPEQGQAIQSAYDAGDYELGQRLQREYMGGQPMQPGGPEPVPGFGVPPDGKTYFQEATPSSAAKIHQKWTERTSRNSVQLEKDLVALEGEGYMVGDALDKLEDWRNMERSDFGDAEEFSEARTEAWDEILEDLAMLEEPDLPEVDAYAAHVAEAEANGFEPQSREAFDGREAQSRLAGEAIGSIQRRTADINADVNARAEAWVAAGNEPGTYLAMRPTKGEFSSAEAWAARKAAQDATYRSTEGAVPPVVEQPPIVERPVGPDTIIKGSTEFLEDGRAIMRGFAAADFSTGVHELAHVIANELDDADKALMRTHYADDFERMPRDFERWVREGKAPIPELQDAFSRMKTYLVKIYATLRGSPLAKQIHPDIRAMFERMFQEVEPENAGMFDPTPDTLTAGLRAMSDESVAPGQSLWMASRDAEVSASIPFHRSLAELDDAGRAELAAFEQNLRTHYPEYTLQKAPNPAIMMMDQGNIATQYLRNRTVLGNVLADHGPLGRVTRLVDWLVSPVPNSELGRAARAALMNELIPHGAKPVEVDRFIQALNTESKKTVIGGLGTRMMGSGRSLGQKHINMMAAGDPQAGVAAIFSEKTVKAIGADNFARVMDRAGNRFIRTLDERGKTKDRRGALARAIADGYGTYQRTPVGDTTRFVSKTMYPLFRFISDPRWWAMNMLESDFIAGVRYGGSASRLKGANKAAPGKASLLHQFADTPGADAKQRLRDEMALFGDNNGMLWARGQAGYISRAFDAARPETTLEALHALSDNDPVLLKLREVIEAQDAMDTGRIRTAGELTDGDYVAAIDRLLYEVDVKGAKPAITDEALAILGPDETARLMPFLQKVWERNDATHKAITESLTGNASRSNLERIGNSYWLYWPLSYQIKATKWLVDIMTNRFLGAKTNLAPAALYAHHVEEHRERLATNPEYAQMFEDNPTAWFMAQMLFPMTPGDIGVSLSRPVRYAGGALGLWGEYKAAEDPITAAAAIMTMGPTYTASLLARLASETLTKNKDYLAP